jgi:outer membrane protein W
MTLVIDRNYRMKQGLVVGLSLMLALPNAMAGKKVKSFISLGAGWNAVGDFYLKDVDNDGVNEDLHMKFKGAAISDLAFGIVRSNGFGFGLQHVFSTSRYNFKKSQSPSAMFGLSSKKHFMNLNAAFGNIFYVIPTRGAKPFVGAGYGFGYTKLRFATVNANTQNAKADDTATTSLMQFFGGFHSAITRNWFWEVKVSRRSSKPSWKIQYGNNWANTIKIKVKESANVFGLSLGYRF